MSTRKLGGNVVEIIRHSFEDNIDYSLLRVSTVYTVTFNLLDPLSINNGYNTNHQLNEAGNIDFIRYSATMQAFIE